MYRRSRISRRTSGGASGKSNEQVDPLDGFLFDEPGPNEKAPNEPRKKDVRDKTKSPYVWS